MTLLVIVSLKQPGLLFKNFKYLSSFLSETFLLSILVLVKVNITLHSRAGFRLNTLPRVIKKTELFPLNSSFSPYFQVFIYNNQIVLYCSTEILQKLLFETKQT